MSVAGFPRIVRFLGRDDAPGASCPHCGAEGRWIYRFRVEDGRELGAMSGCVQLFPVSRIALEDQRLREKAERYAKNGWTLNRRDQQCVDALEEFFASGLGDERSILEMIRSAKRANQARFGGRGWR